MNTMLDVIPLIAGTPTDIYQSDLLYMLACIVTVIGIMFFYKLFLLIGGFISTKGR